MVEQKDQSDKIQSISGTKIRDALLNGEPISEALMQKKIVDYLKERIENGEPVFVD